MEKSTRTFIKATKRILWYIKYTLYFGLFYYWTNKFDLVGYKDSD